MTLIRISSRELMLGLVALALFMGVMAVGISLWRMV